MVRFKLAFALALIAFATGLMSAPAAQEKAQRRAIRAAGAFSFVTTQLPPAIKWVTYSFQFQTQGGHPPIKFGTYMTNDKGRVDPASPRPGEVDTNLYHLAGVNMLAPGNRPLEPWEMGNNYQPVAGLKLSDAGEIRGIAETPGYFKLIIWAVDSQGAKIHGTFALQVKEPTH